MTTEEKVAIAKDAYERYRVIHPAELKEWNDYRGQDGWVLNVQRLLKSPNAAPLNSIEKCVLEAIAAAHA